MRYDPEGKVTAGDLVNGLSERELTDILWEHGGERQAGRIAGAIIRERRKRPFSSTLELAECIARAKRGAGGRIHPATRAFQALRIATNSELANLEAGLQAAVDVLGSGGRLAVVSYHSGEHRLLKRFLRKNSGVCVCPPGVPLCVCGRKDVLVVLTRRGVSPSPEEVRDNPRARSGRLRAAEKKEGVG
jgi:16S rRNA (cytosine1402-N4)-methyltransferase